MKGKLKEKLKRIFDRRFFGFVTLVFLVSFVGGLVWFWGKIGAQAGTESFGQWVETQAEDQEESKSKDEARESIQEENAIDASFPPAVLGEATESTTQKTATQAQVSLNLDSLDLTSLASDALSQLSTALLKNDPSLLYNLAGQDLRLTFGEDGFARAVASEAKIVGVSIISGPRIFGEWAEATLELTSPDGVLKRYTVILHLEEGAWKLFGTDQDSG